MLTSSPSLTMPPSTQALMNNLETLKHERFSGVLSVSAETCSWQLYFYLGRILFASGGNEPVHRWQRMLKQHVPQANAQELAQSTIQADVASIAHTQYEQLGHLFQQRVISREQAGVVVTGLLDEIFFDIHQQQAITFQTGDIESWTASNPLTLVNLTESMNRANHAWHAWHVAGLRSINPDSTPVLKQPDALRTQVSSTVYQSLVTLLDGKKSLRDIAVDTKITVFSLTHSLHRFIQQGVIVLPPVVKTTTTLAVRNTAPLIACVDDSLLICQNMELILTSAGYRYLPILDPIRGFSTLLKQKPDLIFLDLVMPQTNGYEVCAKLRKTDAFRNTPIIMLTGNIIDWLRAQFVGANTTMGKPVDANAVLAITQKHIAC